MRIAIRHPTAADEAEFLAKARRSRDLHRTWIRAPTTRAGLRAVVRHAFRVLRLHRLEANIQPGNRGSIALAKACGFRKEGYSRRYLKIAGRGRDHERWAIVAS
jgi:RimJ/RimL family protein N-acetyltransferase